MITIGVLNSKGGVGKTTLTTALAVRAAQDFKQVAIVDLDPQLGAMRWYEFRTEAELGENPFVVAGDARVVDAVDSLERSDVDVAFFDGVPGALSRTAEAIEHVDFVVIPMKAADQDMASTEYTVAACLENEKPYLIVINEALPGNRPDKRAQEVKDTLASLDQPVSKQTVHRRVGYVDAVNLGKAASELRGQDVAAAEIDALYKEIMAKVKKIMRAA